jgi:hypothetical protein
MAKIFPRDRANDVIIGSLNSGFVSRSNTIGRRRTKPIELNAVHVAVGLSRAHVSSL